MSYGTEARQVGSQEAPIVKLVHPITKLAGVVTTRESIKTALEMAWQAMHEGRKGPAWVDLPVDLQWA
jgi:acetolactate synthase-1/2/3 large subunit